MAGAGDTGFTSLEDGDGVNTKDMGDPGGSLPGVPKAIPPAGCMVAGVPTSGYTLRLLLGAPGLSRDVAFRRFFKLTLFAKGDVTSLLDRDRAKGNGKDRLCVRGRVSVAGVRLMAEAGVAGVKATVAGAPGDNGPNTALSV